jgi:hypothetical protein
MVRRRANPAIAAAMIVASDGIDEITARDPVRSRRHVP